MKTRFLPALLAALIVAQPALVHADNVGAIQGQITQSHGAPVNVSGAPTNGQVLTFNATTGTWVAGAAGGGETWAQTLALGASSGGTSPTITAGDVMIFASSGAAAVSGANTGKLRYNSATQTFQVSLNGAAYTDMATGTVTLQGAYNGGNTISTTSAIAVTNNAANNNSLLTLGKAPAGAQSGDGLSVTLGANASGNAGVFVSAGSGTPLIARSTGTASQALSVDATSGTANGILVGTNASSTYGIRLSMNRGVGVLVDQAVGDPAISVTGGTQTTSQPVLTATQTWNAGGVTFKGISLDITNTASAAASRLLDLQVASSSVFGVDVNGNAFARKGTFTTTAASSSNAILNVNDGSYAGISALAFFGTDNASPVRLASCSSAGADFDLPMVFYRSRGTMASQSSVNDGDYLGRIQAQALTGGGFTTQPCGVEFRAQGTVGSGNLGGAILFLTNPDGSGTQSERLAIRNNASAAFPSGGFLAWTSSATNAVTGTIDATLSRNAAGIVQVGTSAANASGTIRAANFQLGASYTTGDILYASDASTLSKLAASTSGYVLTSNGAGVAPSWQAAAGGGATLFYGDGSDGTATLDGSTVVAAMTPVGNVYTATRDLFFSTLTVNSGITLAMRGYTLSCSSALTNNGTIHCDGNDASGATAGATLSGSLGNGAGGGTGNNSTLSSQAGGSGDANYLGGGGGGGGRSDGTQQSAGAASSNTGSRLVARLRRNGGGFEAGATINVAVWQSGEFAGRGSGDGVNSGGGGGGGGAPLRVAAKSITTGASGAYRSRGGTGGNGTGGTAGGGGGGPGGCVVIYYDTSSGTALSGSNVTAPGGTGGTGSTTAGNGTNGVAGSTFIIQRQ